MRLDDERVTPVTRKQVMVDAMGGRAVAGASTTAYLLQYVREDAGEALLNRVGLGFGEEGRRVGLRSHL